MRLTSCENCYRRGTATHRSPPPAFDLRLPALDPRPPTPDLRRLPMASHHSPAFLKLVDDAKTRVREVSVEATRARLGTRPAPVLIDTREESEWHAGHAAGAVHLGKGIIERDIEARVPDKDTEIILYCGGGFRSALAGDALQQMGYTNVFSMAGGWRAWQAAGAPVERG